MIIFYLQTLFIFGVFETRARLFVNTPSIEATFVKKIRHHSSTLFLRLEHENTVHYNLKFVRNTSKCSYQIKNIEHRIPKE